ncbi:MAG: hypothetical protein II983_03430, partial [Firmicutes bacterium]|nr:hypothetical protein [Bacillota bacterium]
MMNDLSAIDFKPIYDRNKRFAHQYSRMGFFDLKHTWLSNPADLKSISDLASALEDYILFSDSTEFKCEPYQLRESQRKAALYLIKVLQPLHSHPQLHTFYLSHLAFLCVWLGDFESAIG